MYALRTRRTALRALRQDDLGESETTIPLPANAQTLQRKNPKNYIATEFVLLTSPARLMVTTSIGMDLPLASIAC